MMMSPTLMSMRTSVLLSLETEVRLFLVKSGQAAVGSYIGCQDGCEPSSTHSPAGVAHPPCSVIGTVLDSKVTAGYRDAAPKEL
jgi:hypothetical protein